MKSYTDINQSKKLAEILPIESADMFWLVLGNTPHIHVLTEPLSNYSRWENYPCWSLAALLKTLKDYQLFSIGLIVYIDNESYRIDSDNPIDACYEMILKLNEQNLLDYDRGRSKN